MQEGGKLLEERGGLRECIGEAAFRKVHGANIMAQLVPTCFLLLSTI